ncbi:MAG TPA: hypothetical protein VGV61_09440, partial [Thermoanaerobaculia bacterium]|nr:hypothetical protein [Thermoanaerobaculia bacterium]
HSTYLRSLGLQSDLRIVIAGEHGPVNQEDILVLRLDRNGGFGSSWEANLAFPFGQAAASGGGGGDRVLVQSDGKVIVAATYWTGDPNNIVDVGVARLLANGAGLDVSFGGQGTGMRFAAP